MKTKIYCILIVVFSLSYSETVTGPCSEPLCDSVNVIAIYQKLGVNIETIGNFFSGERISSMYFRCFIDTFPEEIGNLTELTKLTIGGQLYPSAMKHLPSSIGNLTKLEYLDLSNNQLEELPPEIGRLVNLRELFLQRNHLTSLPDSIVNITKLDRNRDTHGHRFDVSFNRICSLQTIVRTWVDTMYSGTPRPTYDGAWEVAQCSGFCANGQKSCGTSVELPRRDPVYKKQHQLEGVFYTLHGTRIRNVNNTSNVNTLPPGCYIVPVNDRGFRRMQVVVR